MSNYRNDKLIKKITNDLEENKKLILSIFKSKKYKLEELLKIYTQNKYDTNKELKAVEAILSIIEDKEKIKVKVFDIILREILTNGYFEEDIIKFLDVCFKSGLKVNSTPDKCPGINLMQEIISYTKENEYKINLLVLYNYLKEKGLDVLNTNFYYHNILDVIKNNDENEELIKVINNDRNRALNLSNEDILTNIKNKYDIDFINSNNENLLFTYASIYYEEEYTLKIIEILLDYGLDPNHVNDRGVTFIHHAIKRNHTGLYIFKLLKLAIKYNYNINYITEDNDDIMTYLLDNTYRENYDDFNILSLLLKNGFKTSNKNNIISSFERNRFNTEEREKCIKLLNDKFNNLSGSEDINYLKKFRNEVEDNYVVLDSYKYLLNEMKSRYNINLLMGEKDTSKTTFLKYFYYINYYKNTLLINKEDIIKKCEVIGQYKMHLLNIIRICAENNIVLLIDDIDEIFLNNMSDLEKNEVSIVIRSYIKEYDLKIIGTIKEDKKEIISKNKLLSDFIYEINLEEINKIDLEKIIEQKLMKNRKYHIQIYFKDEKQLQLFKHLLLILSNKNYINNPDISSICVINSIIDNVFKYHFKFNFLYGSLDHIIFSIKNYDYIREEVKEIVIKELETNNIEEIESKILKKLP